MTAAKADYSPDVRCANKRSAMWCQMAQWLKSRAIPNDPELKAQLIGPEYSENAQGIVLERKEDMKARGLASPDVADSLCLTFASPVFTAAMSGLAGPGDHLVVSEWDPFSEAAGSFCSGNPSALSLAATTTWPIPMKRPRILFWSRQNSNVSDRALFGMGRPGSASIFTISRLKACAGPPMLMDRPWTSGASLLARGFNAPSYNR